MNTRWSLDKIYKGLDDPAYIADFKKLEVYVQEEKELVQQAEGMELKTAVEQMLQKQEEITEIAARLDSYIVLSQSVDAKNGRLMAEGNRLMKLLSSAGAAEAAAQKLYAKIPDVEAMAAQSPIIRDYCFLLENSKRNAVHLLPDDVEEMISALNLTGGAAWEKLESFLTSTVKVPYDGSEITLSEVRNLAYSPDPKVRKLAYEAEIASYDKIADSVAFALNNIKGQVSMLCEKRGYESPLQMTLEQAHMNRETLNAMMAAIEEYLPVFRTYLKKKAEILGYTKGLPWYELFAPIGNSDKVYTLEEAKEFLVTKFEQFSSDMSDVMKRAFEQEWIDFYPRDGKMGGAFCEMTASIGESRILTNYDGYFGSLNTLAHELGHAYHNAQIMDQRAMNQNYSMPVAETASTFNEIHLNKAAIREAEGEEKRYLLENNLMEQTQVIVDIYSRYLFETAVFEQCRDKFLMASDCKDLMSEAQKKAYGDGLDPHYLHPYMWVCKSHYYSEELSFYNFPYAFGSLFALGLYSIYEQEVEAFVPKYNAMLNATPVCTVEEAAAMVGIDLAAPEFWRRSLSQIAEMVEEFCR